MNPAPLPSVRAASISRSCEDLPCSLLLVLQGGDEVVGYARLLPVAGRRNSGLVESGKASFPCTMSGELCCVWSCSGGVSQAERQGTREEDDGGL